MNEIGKRWGEGVGVNIHCRLINEGGGGVYTSIKKQR